MNTSILKRILISVALGIILAAIITEFSYLMLKREDREPQRVELVIPSGAAASVANGERLAGVPEEMNFVVGDMFVVINMDNVEHQLGLLQIPPGASGTLNLDTEESYILESSFLPTNTLSLDVRPPVTLSTRLTGILLAGLPMGALFSVYSTLLISNNKKKKTA